MRTPVHINLSGNIGGQVPHQWGDLWHPSTLLCAMFGFCPPCAMSVESVVDCTVNELNRAGEGSCIINFSAANVVGNGKILEGADNPEKEENIGPDFIP